MKLLLTDNIKLLNEKVSETQPVTIVIDGKRICLAKNQGKFYAIEDTCPHQNASLGKGKVYPSGGVECPFHHYVFDIRTGECTVGACRKLDTYEVIVEGEKVFIEI